MESAHKSFFLSDRSDADLAEEKNEQIFRVAYMQPITQIITIALSLWCGAGSGKKK